MVRLSKYIMDDVLASLALSFYS